MCSPLVDSDLFQQKILETNRTGLLISRTKQAKKIDYQRTIPFLTSSLSFCIPRLQCTSRATTTGYDFSVCLLSSQKTLCCSNIWKLSVVGPGPLVESSIEMMLQKELLYYFLFVFQHLQFRSKARKDRESMQIGNPVNFQLIFA